MKISHIVYISLFLILFSCSFSQAMLSVDPEKAKNKMEKIEIVLGDITQQSVEAIINAANDRLLAGGGVCGAIHKAAGPELARACNKVGSCSTGHAVITPGYGLKAPYVIHAVGPIWHGGTNNESELLKECYQSIFQIVEEKGLKSVALPAISIGIYGYPKQEATHIALQEAIAFSQKNPSVKVVFVCFDDATLQMYEEQFKQIKKSV